MRGCCASAGALIAALLLALPAPGAAGEDSPAIEAHRAAFAELDRLHTPALKTLPLVRVSTGGWSQRGNGPPEAHRIVGFLISEEEGHFSVFRLDHTTVRYGRSASDVPEHERIAFERIDLARHVADVLKARGGRTPSRVSLPREPLVLATLARACATRGLHDLAFDLCKAASAGLETTLVEAVREKLAGLRMWRNVLAFDDPSVSFESLRDRFREYLRDFPEGTHAKRAGESLALLERMVIERPPTGDRVDRLVFDLRNQNGQQPGQPGSCDVFLLMGGGEDSPAHRLAEIGWPAVPRLIEALIDDRFTRSIEYHRHFYFSHRVLRVGACATAILHRITGKVFRGAGSQGTARAWWKTVEARGERDYLVEIVATGQDPALARRLLARYPGAAPAALLPGLSAAEGNTREEYLDLVAALPGGEARMLLEQEIRNGPDLGTRLRAAKLVWERGRDDSVPLMIAEWLRTDLAARDWRFHVEKLAEFLGGCGDVRALDALRLRYAEFDVNLAIDVVGDLLQPGWFGSRRKTELDAAGREGLVRLLLVALDDVRVRHGLSMGRGTYHWSDPRVCDVAGVVLAHRFPGRFEFDNSAARAKRDRQVFAIRNVVRKERGERLLPIPAPRLATPAPTSTTCPLLDAVVSGEGRDAARAKLEALGLAAIDAVLRRLESLEPDARDATGLGALARRLAAGIAILKVKPGPVSPGHDLRVYLEALKGRALTGPRVGDLLFHLTNNLPSGSAGFDLAVDREEARGGFRLVLDFAPGPAKPSDDGSPGWEHSVNLDAGKVQDGSHGASSERYGRSRETWDDLVETFGKAIAQDPDQPVELLVAVRKEG